MMTEPRVSPERLAKTIASEERKLNRQTNIGSDMLDLVLDLRDCRLRLAEVEAERDAFEVGEQRRAHELAAAHRTLDRSEQRREQAEAEAGALRLALERINGLYPTDWITAALSGQSGAALLAVARAAAAQAVAREAMPEQGIYEMDDDYGERCADQLEALSRTTSDLCAAVDAWRGTQPEAR
jgi:hypothetical protein